MSKIRLIKNLYNQGCCDKFISAWVLITRTTSCVGKVWILYKLKFWSIARLYHYTYECFIKTQWTDSRLPLYLICAVLTTAVLAGLSRCELRNEPTGVTADRLLQYEAVMEPPFKRSSPFPEITTWTVIIVILKTMKWV